MVCLWFRISCFGLFMACVLEPFIAQGELFLDCSWLRMVQDKLV